MDSHHSNASGEAGQQRTSDAHAGGGVDRRNRGREDRPGRYKTGFFDGEYQDAGVRGLVCIFGKRGSGKTTRAKSLIRDARRVVVWDPVACCGDLGWQIVTQPGKLQQVLAAAGPRGDVQVIYQPRGGDLVEHWESVGWLCIKRGNLILMVDEVDGVCSAGSSKNAASPYWKRTTCTPALGELVQYGRHSRVALIGVARAPQDVWRRLTGQSLRMLVFTMNERLELEALRGRLGSATDQLPNLGKFEYLDWNDGGDVKVAGGKA